MRLNKTGVLLSWASYDFANTIFSAVVLTVYFPLYLTERSGANWTLGAASTSSMLLAGLATPFLGTLSDHTGKTKAYLVRTTLASIFFLSLLSLVREPAFLIALFLAACFFYHASLVFYNSLLPVAAPPERQGFASGLGTALGYLGVVAALPVAHAVDQTLGRPAVFGASALLFGFFSLPTFFYVPERRVSEPRGVRWQMWTREWKKILGTLKGLREKPELLLFLGGNFFAMEALNTTIFWLSVYMREVFHPEQNVLVLFLMGTNTCAFLAGIAAGYLTDRFGAARTVILASGSLAATLGLLAWTSDFASFVLITLSGGAFAISGLWTAGRKRLVELAPKERVGEYFGLYGLTTKLSVIGSLVFSIVADQAGFRTALRVLLFPAVVGWLFLIFSKRAAGKP